MNNNELVNSVETAEVLDAAFEAAYKKAQSIGRFFNTDTNKYSGVYRIVAPAKFYTGAIKEARVESATIDGTQFNRIIVMVEMADGGLDAEIRFTSAADRPIIKKPMLLFLLDTLGVIEKLEGDKTPTGKDIVKILNDAKGTSFKFGYKNETYNEIKYKNYIFAEVK